MRKLLKGTLLGLAAVFFLAGSALAGSYYYPDTTYNWPGYNTSSAEQIGEPAVTGIRVNTDANNNLTSVIVYLSGRTGVVDDWINGSNGAASYDSLFINANYDGTSYEKWTYYVRDNTGDNATGATLYSVSENYSYLYATQPYAGLNGRWGHPSGIDKGLTEDTTGLLVSVIYDSVNNTLTYSFNTGIVLGENWVIGYGEWCANDVILTPVPEPGILMLIGFGLIGLGAIRRRFGK